MTCDVAVRQLGARELPGVVQQLGFRQTGPVACTKVVAGGTPAAKAAEEEMNQAVDRRD